MIEDAPEFAEYLTELAPDLSLEIGHEREATIAQQQASITAALRVMRAIERDRAEIREARRLERDSISQIEARELAPLDTRYAAYERWVLMVAELIEWPKRKQSHDTPYGSFGVRKMAATVELVDEAKTLAWAMIERPDMIKTKQVLSWGELKKTLDASEDVLPDGVERIEAKAVAYVKVS